MSEDPIGFRGKDLNLYRYVSNNSVLYTDPSGLFSPPIFYPIPIEVLPHPPGNPGHNPPSELEKGVEIIFKDYSSEEEKGKDFDNFLDSIKDKNDGNNPYNHSKTCPFI